ncbi:MAG: hypothetical protein WC617_06170 [Rhodanobacter sp.]
MNVLIHLGGFMGTSALMRLADGLGMIGALTVFVVVVLLAALLLCLIFRVVIGYLPSYPHAIAVALLSLVVAAVAAIVAGMVLSQTLAGWLAWGAACWPAPDGSTANCWQRTVGASATRRHFWCS